MIVTTPPMGWNSWNTIGHDINEEIVLKIADIMAEQGYKQAGYEYVIIDDCWLLRERDENGRLVPDPQKFPHGMKYVSDYVHSKGLKFGMYSCAGARTCAKYPSSYEHEYIDAQSFAQWGVDYLKYDFCNFYGEDPKRAYLIMSQALRATGRDILFAACNWGWGDKNGSPDIEGGYAPNEKSPSEWMRGCGVHSYRSTTDINDTWEKMKYLIQKQHNSFSGCGTGFYNDMDMLTVGMYGKGHVSKPSKMEYAQYELQFAYWCFVGSPLIMGADLSQVDDQCKALMLNKELIRINQDKECRPPYFLGHDKPYSTFNVNGVYVYCRLLEDGEFAIGVFNLYEDPKSIVVPFACHGIPYASGKKLQLRELVTGTDCGCRSGDMVVSLPAYGARVYRCKVIDA